jgi:hypothetical protein
MRHSVPVFSQGAGCGCGQADEAQDPADIALETIEGAIRWTENERVNPVETVALLALESVSRLIAYGVSPLDAILEALRQTAPTRAALLHAANEACEDAPPLSALSFALAPAAHRAN